MATVALCSGDSTEAQLIRDRLSHADPSIALRWLATVDELLAAVSARPPDLALVDARLVGVTAVAALAGLPVTPFPVLVVVGPEDVPLAQELLRAGASDYAVRGEAFYADLPHVVERTLAGWRLRQEARRSAALQSGLLDALGHSVAIVDSDLAVIHLNRHCQEAYGWSPDATVGMALTELFRPSPEGDGRVAMVSALCDGRRWSGECAAMAATGSSRTVRLSITPIRDEAGALACAVCIAHDAGGRLRDREALRQAEARLEAISRVLPALLCVLDPELNVIYAEGSMLERLQLTPAEVVGRSAYDFYTPVEYLRGLRDRVISGEEVCVADRFGDLWVDLRMAPLRDDAGRIDSVLCLVTDVGERKLALDAARQSEERYRALVAALPDAIVLIGHDLRVRVANEAAAATAGVSVEEMTDQALGDGVHGSARERLARVVREVMSRQEARSFCAGYECPDGCYRWYDLHFSPVPEGVLIIEHDITDRRLAQQALRQAEVKYRALVEQVPAVIYSVARRGGEREGFISPSVEQVLGFTPDEWFSSQDFWEKRLHPDDRDRVVARANRLYNDGEPFVDEFRYIARDGSVVWVHEETAAVSGADPTTLHFHGVLTDITELKLVQSALSQSQAAYELVVNTMAEGLAVLDCDGNYLFLNKVQAGWTAGRPAADVVGHNVHEYLPRDQAERYIERARATVDTMRPSGEDVLVTTRMGDRWFHRILQPISYVPDAPPAVLSISHDITARVLAEQEAKEADSRWRYALENATDGVWDWNLAAGHIHYSSRWKAVLGYADDEIGDSPSEWGSLIHPDDREPARRQLERHLRGDAPYYSSEHRLLAKDGTYRWVLDRGRVVAHDADGKPARAIGTHTDITEGKRAEQDRLEMERRLMQAQKLESLGALAGGVAHDFNNLLAAIIGNLELAQHELPPHSVVRMNLDNGIAAAQRAADLTRQMLAYAGRGRYVTQPTDLSVLVEENAHILRAAVGRNATFRADLERHLPSVLADTGQVQQALLNLITNASEAIGNGAGVVTVSTAVRDCDECDLAQSRVEPSPAPGRFVALEVSDTGVGMSAETQRRLFDPFFSTKFAGRGLGLAAVQGIVRGHGGAVLVQSEEGVGSTVTLLFPVAGTGVLPDDDGESETVPRPAPRAARGAVLVVDDEEVVRMLCARMVARSGYQALTAAGGEEALQVFRQHVADVVCVILDQAMPGMDGLATLKALQSIDPEVKVILASPYGDREAARRFGGLGVAGFVQKPCRVAQVTAELARVVGA